MSSNLPDGVTENTFGAPFNEEEVEVEVTIVIRTTMTVAGPLTKLEKLDKSDELSDTLYEKVKAVIEQVDDLRIEKLY